MLDSVVMLLRSLSDEPTPVGVGIPGGMHEAAVVTVPNLPNWDGPVGEIGHAVVRVGGALCGCGPRVWRGLRRSPVAPTAAMVAAGPRTALFDTGDKLGRPALTFKVWSRALAQQDELAGELFATASAMMGIGIGCGSGSGSVGRLTCSTCPG